MCQYRTYANYLARNEANAYNYQCQYKGDDKL